MKNHNHKKTSHKTHFGLHVTIEKAVIKNIMEKQELRALNTLTRNDKNIEQLHFVENVGATQLFSMAQAEHLYRNAKNSFGDDRWRYGQSKILEAIKLGNRRMLAKAPAADEFRKLKENFPNFAEVVDVLNGAAALCRLSAEGYLQIPPLLLLGPPGVGKTAFVQAFGKIAGLPFNRLDIGMSSTGSVLSGLSLDWGTGRTGQIFNLLTESEYANPIFMLDEIDKSRGNYNAPVEPVLLSLLEPESAICFRDEAISLPINTSHIIWIATANYIDQISSPLLSRFTVINIQQPSPEQSKQVIQSIYHKIRNDKPWGFRFPKTLNVEVVNKLSLCPPRLASKNIQQAFGVAAKNHRTEILLEDLPVHTVKKVNRIGFI